MAKITTKKELEALIKATEKSRALLRETWKKVEDLDAAIQSAKRIEFKSKGEKEGNKYRGKS